MRLQGKIAVITGASSGMGLAMATRFAAEGASIVAGEWNGERLDAAVAAIEADGGAIVGIASTAGLHGGAAGAAYPVSKHGLVGLTRSTACMYAKRGIHCNAICPEATATNIAESMPEERLNPLGAARASEFAGLIPAYLQPTDIAALALFLASDESRNINGAITPADGGWNAA